MVQIQMDHMDASAYWQIAFALLLFACACRYARSELEKDIFFEEGPPIRPKVRKGVTQPSSAPSSSQPPSLVSHNSRDEDINRVQARLLVSLSAYCFEWMGKLIYRRQGPDQYRLWTRQHPNLSMRLIKFGGIWVLADPVPRTWLSETRFFEEVLN
jgi:hypothetical protein